MPESNPANITFDFDPDFIYVIGIGYRSSSYIVSNSYPYTFIPMADVTTSYINKIWMTGTSSNKSYVKRSSDGKTLYWYATYDPDNTFSRYYNENGTVYYFCGIK